jgi:hypothetical protein
MADAGRARCAAVEVDGDTQRGDANGSTREVVEEKEEEEAELGRGMAAIRGGDNTAVLANVGRAVFGRSSRDGGA